MGCYEMIKTKRLLAIFLTIATMLSIAVVSSFTANTESVGITIHYYSESGTPNIYYWNSLPTNTETDYPGPSMISEGNGWYKYSFSDKTKINLMFVTQGNQSNELTRTTGEWWYKGTRWYSKDPSNQGNYERTDLREDSIYFVITTRFYDGDTGNNVHCWDDGQANNPDSDPAWRGDFKGLIQKLDYIKALGFTAIWITPVVENASGYDYHGYHAFDFTKVDPRYESSGATYQDLIDAAHDKGMKIIQDVVINHAGNFGESFLAPMFTKDYDNLETADCMKVISDSLLNKSFPNYNSLKPENQYQARLSVMKDTQVVTEEFSAPAGDPNNYFHHNKDLSWESPSVQLGQIAGDCVDINTENKTVAEYLNSAYTDYINMGVDAFRLDTEKHVSRLTLNELYFPEWQKAGGDKFFIYGEVCTRVYEYWNHGIPAISAPFYTWAETDSKYKNCFGNDWQANVNLSLQHYKSHESTSSALKSDNVFLNGITYHTPDYSKSNGTGVIDFPMHWNFGNASSAFTRGKEEDPYYNDSTFNVTYVDSHDYGPDCDVRYPGDTSAWAENLSLMYTFRGIPCVYYGSETQFMGGQLIDVGPNAPLSTTGRAYYGDRLEGTVTATDFGKYTASGTVSSTLSAPISAHLRQLNLIRQAVPALQKGQYTVNSNYVDGNMAYIRRYTNASEGVDSLALCTVSGGATFKNIPNGTYIDAVTGDQKTVTNGTLTTDSIGKGNARIYVACGTGFTGIDGQIGENGAFLK